MWNCEIFFQKMSITFYTALKLYPATFQRLLKLFGALTPYFCERVSWWRIWTNTIPTNICINLYTLGKLVPRAIRKKNKQMYTINNSQQVDSSGVHGLPVESLAVVRNDRTPSMIASCGLWRQRIFFQCFNQHRWTETMENAQMV